MRPIGRLGAILGTLLTLHGSIASAQLLGGNPGPVTIVNGGGGGIPGLTADGSGLHYTVPATGVILNFTPTASTTPGGTASYTLEAAVVPLANRVVSLDAALPASQAAIAANTPGIQTDTNSNVITLTDASGAVQTSANSFGRTQLTNNGVGGFPYFHSTPAGYNNTYDALTLTPALATTMFAPKSAAWQAAFVIRQTGTSANGLMNVVFADNTQVNILGGGTDGRLLVGQNNGAANGTESVNALSALNQWEVLIVTCDGRRFSVYRNGQLTFQTNVDSSHVGGARIAPVKFEFLNNAQADVSVIDVAAGTLGVANLDAYDKALGTRYAIPVSTIATGPGADIAPSVTDLTATWLTTPNFPTTDILPIANAGLVPANGLALASGAMQNFDVVFGSGQVNANVTTAADLRKYFYFNYLVGNLTNPIGAPQDGQPGVYNAVLRHYAPGDPNDVTPVLSDGVHIKAIASQNGTDVSPGNIWAGMLRFPTVFRPGMTLQVRYKSPSSPFSWAPIWLFSGEQRTPGPGGNPYLNNNTPTALLRAPQSGHLLEIDINDNFSRSRDGTPTGQQVDFGTPDIYGDTFVVRPYTDYVANGAGGYLLKTNGAPNFLQQSLDTSAAFVNLVFNWRGDGSDLMDTYYNGVLVDTMYQEWNATTAGSYVDAGGTTQVMGMTLFLGNQAVPASLSATVTPADLANCTMVVQEVAAWNGNIANPDSYRPTVQAPNLTVRATSPNYQGRVTTASGIFTSGAPVSLTATLDGTALTLSSVTITTTAGSGNYARGTWSAQYTDSATLGTHTLVVSGTGPYASISSNKIETVVPVPVALGVTSISTLIPGATATVNGVFNFGAPATLTATQDGTAFTPGTPVITIASGAGATAAGTFSFTQVNPAAGSHALVVSGTGVYAATAASYGYTTAAPSLTQGGFTFAWTNQNTATFTGGGANPLVVSDASHAGNNPSILLTPLVGTARTYTAKISGSYPTGSNYSLGLVMAGASANLDFLNNLFATSTQSAEYVVQGPVTNLYATTLISYATFGLGYIGSPYCARAVYDDTSNWTFLVSQTCLVNSWTSLGVVSNATLGSPTSIGIFVNANGGAGGGPMTVTFSGWTETTATNVQAAF